MPSLSFENVPISLTILSDSRCCNYGLRSFIWYVCAANLSCIYFHPDQRSAQYTTLTDIRIKVLHTNFTGILEYDLSSAALNSQLMIRSSSPLLANPACGQFTYRSCIYICPIETGRGSPLQTRSLSPSRDFVFILASRTSHEILNRDI